MSVYYEDERVTLHHGDCLEVLRSLPDASVDSVVTDPPYNLSFMGREWDSHVSAVAFQQWCELWATECLRALKPGGHLISFGGTRTWHRLTCAVEDAGFEVRDSIAWLYGSGFPKSLDVSKAIDKAAGAEREVVGRYTRPDGSAPRDNVIATKYSGTAYNGGQPGGDGNDGVLTAPATPDAERWQGWGTALKPAFEPVVCARKPLSAVPLGSEVNRLHHLIGALLWLSLSPAKRAGLTSPSSPAERGAAWCASALASAATATSPGESVATDTYNSPALASTLSSIVSSWSSTLAALSGQTSTSTTSTRSSTTTGLRTLSSLLAPLTSQTTMPMCGCLLVGPSSPAPNVVSSSTDEWASWLHTLSASVPASAIEGIALVAASALAELAASLSDDQGAGSSAAPRATTGAASSSSPAFEPIVVARKPLPRTVAANVLEHGTGALNVDACRVGEGGQLKWAKPRDMGYHGGTDSGPVEATTNPAGRWPTNVVLDDTQAAELDRQSGVSRDGVAVNRNRGSERPMTVEGAPRKVLHEDQGYGGEGGASRFFKVISQTPSDLVFLPVECESWQPPGDASTRAESTSAGRSTESRYASSPIGGYGSKQTDPSPTATRSTTGTTIPSTTTSTTSCASPPSGTTTTTSDSASSTDGSPESRSAAASGATPTSPSTPSPSGERAPSTATAESAPRRTAESGSPETATSSTHDDARSEHAASTPDFPTFRYQAKAPTRERPFYTAEDGSRVAHPTTKPLDLMRWLVRLVTPPGGTVLEPFAGSGTTVEACIVEGFHCIAIEREAEYLPLITQRVNRRLDPVAAIKQTGDDLGLFDLEGEGA